MTTQTKKLWSGAEIQSLLDNRIRYKDWSFIVEEREVLIKSVHEHTDIELRLRAQWMGLDVVTGKLELQKSRWWPLSKHMTPTEIFQTALLCVLKAEEHEIREQFQYWCHTAGDSGTGSWTAPYNSHIHIDALARMSEELDLRVDDRPEAPANQRKE